MITAKFNGVDVNIPTSWSDVPYKNYISYTKTDNQLEQVSCLIGIEKDKLEKLNSESLGAILMAMSFTTEEPSAYMAELNSTDVGRESYGKIEMAKAILLGNEKPIDAVLPILKLYTGIDYADMPTDIVHPLGAFFLLSCIAFSNATSD
jgi:hypothetical protein